MRTSRLVIVVVAAMGVVAPATSHADEGHAYIGTKNCKKCHIKEWKSWSATAMANAFEVLKPGERAEAKTAAGLDPAKDYSADPECVRCHVTGFGAETGFIDFETTPDLAGVGCEMCHGAGGTYTQDQYMSLKNKEFSKAEVVAAGLVDEVSADQCTRCHNSESPFVGEDFVFDFEAMRSQGTHENFPLKYAH